MINCIFYTLFFALFLNISVGSLKYSQVHRTFMSIYKGMFEACTITIDDNGEPTIPYFNMDKMDLYINDYFKSNLSKYTKDYKVNYSYLGGEGTFLCRKNCRTIQIKLEANINTFFRYKNNEIFTIADGDALWMKN